MTVQLIETRKIYLFKDQNIFNTLKDNINNFLKTELPDYKFLQPTILNDGLPLSISPEMSRLEVKSITNDIVIILAVERLDIIFLFEGNNNNFNDLKRIFYKFDNLFKNKEFYATRLAIQGLFIYKSKNPEKILLSKINQKFINPIEPVLQFGERYNLENSKFHINDTYTLKTGIQDNITEKNKIIIIKRDMNTNETAQTLDENIINLFNVKMNNFIDENKVQEYLGI